MAKNSVGAWDTTAANNTDVGSVNINEGMFPDGVNDAMRNIMKQIADFRVSGYFGGATAPLAFAVGTNPLQVQGTSAAGAGLALAMFSATAATCARLDFYRSRNAAIGSADVVQSGDRLGVIGWSAAQQTGTFSNQQFAAAIIVTVDGTVTSGAGADMPGKISLNTSADGSGGLGNTITMDSTGLLTLSAGQIAFPASQNASAGANTLDDYEEGTFTPNITFGGGSTGITYTSHSGTYTKVGRQVVCNLFISLSNKGSSSGVALITNLPFTPTQAAAANISKYTNFSGLTGVLMGTASSGTDIALEQTGATGTATITETSFTNTSIIYLTVAFSV